MFDLPLPGFLHVSPPDLYHFEGTADQLADRLVPDFGLDDDGSLILNFGDRRFRVGFDEQLKPTIADEDGARRKVLPKPGSKDDPTLAPAAYALFTGLKKDVKSVAADQIRRFEQAIESNSNGPSLCKATSNRNRFLSRSCMRMTRFSSSISRAAW